MKFAIFKAGLLQKIIFFVVCGFFGLLGYSDHFPVSAESEKTVGN